MAQTDLTTTNANSNCFEKTEARRQRKTFKMVKLVDTWIEKRKALVMYIVTNRAFYPMKNCRSNQLKNLFQAWLVTLGR